MQRHHPQRQKKNKNGMHQKNNLERREKAETNNAGVEINLIIINHPYTFPASKERTKLVDLIAAALPNSRSVVVREVDAVEKGGPPLPQTTYQISISKEIISSYISKR